VEDPEAVDEPVRFTKRRRIVLHIAVASSLSWALRSKNSACPVATEGQIKNDLMLAEVRSWAIVAESEVRVRGSPIVWIWSVGGQVGGHRGVREEPHPDSSRRVPFGGVHPAPHVVERRAINVLVAADPAAGVAGGHHVAVRKLTTPSSEHVGSDTSLVTAIVRVQRGQVSHLFIDAFDNVNLSTIWPTWSACPKSWPRAAPGRHMSQVNHEQAIIEAALGFRSERSPPSPTRNIRVVSAHVHLAARIDESKIQRTCVRQTLKIDVAMRRIISSDKIHRIVK